MRDFPQPIFPYPERWFKKIEDNKKKIIFPFLTRDRPDSEQYRDVLGARSFFFDNDIACDNHILSFSLRIYHLPAPALRYSTRASTFPVAEIFNSEVNRSRSPLFKLFICFKASPSTFAHTRWFQWVPPTDRRMDHPPRPPAHTNTTPTRAPQHTYTTPPDKLVTWFIK